jgi:hypothetical protein
MVKPNIRTLRLTQRMLLALAACMWLATVILTPSKSGVGAALSGHELADLIDSGSVGRRVPPVMGLAWYLMPLSAAVVLATLGLRGSVANMLRSAAALLAISSALGFTVLLTRWATLGPGSWCAVGGAGMALVAIAIEAVTRSRRSSSVL